MSKSTRQKSAPDQTEFSFIDSDLLSGPDLAGRVLCVERVPEQRTSLPWVPIFADRVPGEHRYKTKRT
jgi:hypothetical protein